MHHSLRMAEWANLTDRFVASMSDELVWVLEPQSLTLAAKFVSLFTSILLYLTVRLLHRLELQNPHCTDAERKLHNVICWYAIATALLSAVQICALAFDSLIGH